MSTIQIPERRYAMFDDLTHGRYILVVKGYDMITAPRWGNFIQWVGGVRPAETRKIKRGAI